MSVASSRGPWRWRLLPLVVVPLLAAGWLGLEHRERLREAAGAEAVDRLIGATVEPVTGETAALLHAADGSGVVVTSVAAGGPADAAGLDAGDIVERIDGRPVPAPARAARLMARHAPPWQVTVRRHGAPHDVAVSGDAAHPPA